MLSLAALERTAAAQARPIAPEPWTPRNALVVVSAERLFGVYAYSSTNEPEQGDSTEIAGVMLSLLYGQSAINSEDDQINPYAVPRIGVDGVIAGSFTLGGNLGFGATLGEIDNGSSERSLPGVSGFAVYARLGYLVVPSATVSIWLRAGPEFFSGNYDDTGARVEYTTRLVAFTLDPQVVITPVPHAAILVGPLVNLGVWGSFERAQSTSSEESALRFSNFGLTAGLALLF